MRTSNYRKFKITKKQAKLVGGAAAVAVLAGIIFFFFMRPAGYFPSVFSFCEFWLTIFISGDIIFYVKGEDGEK